MQGETMRYNRMHLFFWLYAAVLALAAFLVFLARWIWLTVRRPRKLLRLARRVLALASAVVLVYCG